MWKKIRLSNYEISDDGQIRNAKKQTILKTSLNHGGYECICISLETKGKKQRCKVHRLVAETFLENYSPDLEIHHINGIRHDNRVINLKCVTKQENNSNRTFKKAVSYVNGKQNIKVIIDLYNSGKTVEEIFILLRKNVTF